MTRYLSTLLLACLLAGCAGTDNRQSAIKAAQVSYIVYETLAPECARETGRMVLIKRTRDLTLDEQDRYEKLIKLSRLMESYRQAHNLYIQTLSDTGKETNRWLVTEYINSAIDLGLSLKLSFEAVRMSP